MSKQVKITSDQLHDGKLLFFTFKRSGVQYLAFKRHSGTSVIDVHGNDFGSWMSLESFEKHLSAGKAEPIATVKQISVISL